MNFNTTTKPTQEGNMNTSSTPSFDVGYFSSASTSKGSTPTTATPATTPGQKFDEKEVHDTYKLGSNPVPPLLREFPKPSEAVDVQAMLERQPGRWTFQGQVHANRNRVVVAGPSQEELKAQRARDFEAAKRDLLRAAENLHSRGIGEWKP